MSKKLLIGAVLIGGMLIGGMNVSAESTHTVKAGDTMYEIAESNGMELEELAEYNPKIENLNLIYVGDKVSLGDSENEQPAQENKPVTESKDVQVNESKQVASTERDIMAQLVNAEAQGETFSGKVGVAEVVLNRVESGSFPNSVKGVVYQPNQFTPVSNGSINNTPTAEDYNAVDKALKTEGSIVGNSLFFYNPDTATSRWLDSKQTTFHIGNHTFKK